MKIRMKILLTMLFLVLATGVAVTAVGYEFARDMAEQEAWNHLLTAAESRRDHVETFLEVQKEAIMQLSESIVIKRLLSADKNNPDYAHTRDDVMLRLQRTAKVRGDGCGIFVLDRNGRTVVSSNQSDIGKDRNNNPYFLGGKQGVFVKDACSSENSGMNSIAFSAPLLDETDFLGVVVIRISMEQIDRISTDRTGMGETGEIFLLNRDGLMITPSRFLNGTFLEQTVETGHSADDLESVYPHARHTHAHDMVICKSYRGVDVLRAHTHVHNMNWCLMAEVSKEEAFAPVVRLRDMMLMTITVLLAVGMILAIVLSGTITAPILRLRNGAERIEAGDLDCKVATKETDEIGELSRTIDRMTAKLKRSGEEVRRYSERLERLVEKKTGELDKKMAEADEQRLATLNMALDLGEANRKMELEIAERTGAEQSLEKRTSELERFNKLAVGRELKMIELKKEINAVVEAAGEGPRYKIVGDD